jgi:hypothetical protein
MIAARYHGPKGQQAILLVLEPGNIEKLKQGEPIHKFLNEFLPNLGKSIEIVIAYTPDIEWVAEQSEADPSRLPELLLESLTRPEIVRTGPSTEDMKQVI